MTLGPGDTALLALAIAFAGFVDSIAGGGGLVTLPAYMAAGVPPGLVLGTNKVSSFMGTAVACFKFRGELRMSLSSVLRICSVAFAGSLLGAWLATLMNPSFLRVILLFALPCVGYVVLVKGLHDGRVGSVGGKAHAIAGAIGTYDGFFGPGTGTFYAILLTRVGGLGIVRATALSKYLNLASNVSALVFFVSCGRADVHTGVLMGLAGMAGNWLGAHTAIKRGVAVIKPVVALVCAGLLAKVAWDIFH